MTWQYSTFGENLTAKSGIVELMEDLGEALNVNPDLLFLGGGNPARIPEFQAIISERIKAIANDPEQLHQLVGTYQSPQGDEVLLKQFAQWLNQKLGWNISHRNISIANGSQSAFFLITNILSGVNDQGEMRKIYLPLLPEYLGYADQGALKDHFIGRLPEVKLLSEQRFKYAIDFDNFELPKNTGGVYISCPTNPSGNVVTASELERLEGYTREAGVPLVIDCAYGAPIPDVIYESSQVEWNENRILVMSLSKLGLPNVRTGIVIAEEGFIERFVSANTLMSLANGGLGPALLSSLLDGDFISTVTQSIIKPFYLKQRDFMLESLFKYLPEGSFRVHEAQGAFFVWVWFENLAITSTELYQRLKARNVLIMDGAPFFFGVEDNVLASNSEFAKHTKECIRLSYCQSFDVIDAAVKIIAEEISSL